MICVEGVQNDVETCISVQNEVETCMINDTMPYEIIVMYK